MNDPLKSSDNREQQLFLQIAEIMHGVSLEMARSIAVNLFINTIRQSVPYRKDAEAIFDELTGRAKTMLLDGHYDSVTGRRRTVFAFTQVIEPPFHVEQDVFFPVDGK